MAEAEHTNNEEIKEPKVKTKKKRSSKPIRKFPYYTIEESIKVPKLIKENNGGNPWAIEQLALALEFKKGSNSFYYLTAASCPAPIFCTNPRVSFLSLKL